MSVETDSETRNEKFKRLGKRRMLRALNSIRLLGNLSSPNYDYSVREVELMRWTLFDQLEKTFSKFTRGQRTEIAFEFEETDIVVTIPDRKRAADKPPEIMGPPVPRKRGKAA